MALSDYYTALTVQRKTETDPLGVGDSYATVATIQGYIQRDSGGERVIKNEYGESATHTLYTNVDSSIVFGDRIVKGSAIYTVVSPGEDDGVVSLGKHKEIGLMRVKSN